MGLNHSQPEDDDEEEYDSDNINPGEEPEPSKDLVSLKLVASEELAPLPKEDRQVKRRSATKERAPAINQVIEYDTFFEDNKYRPVSVETTDLRVREEVQDHALPAVTVPSSANIQSQKKNLSYLKKLKKHQWTELNEKLEVIMEGYIKSSIGEILNHEEISNEEKIEFAFRFFADEIYKSITRIIAPESGNLSKRKSYRERKPKLIIDMEEKLKMLKKKYRFSKNRNLQVSLIKKEMNTLFRKINKEKQIKKNLEKEKLKKISTVNFYQNPWKYTMKTISKKDLSPEPKFTLESARTFFTKEFSKGDDINFQEVPNWIQDELEPKKPMEEDIIISVSQYRRILKKKKSWSKCGRDGIPYGVYKNLPCLDETVVLLFGSINILGNHYPKGWQEAEACFIYKKGESHLEKSYRTITLTQSISKIYSSILLSKMMEHMIKNNYLATSQKGFIEGTSGCLEHHYQLEEIMKGLKANFNLFYCTTDIRSAYRSVNHDLIHWALNHYYFSDTFKQIVASMYSRQKMFMTVEGTEFDIDVQTGVFEGEVLSVGLFLIIFNPLLKGLNDVKFARNYGLLRNGKYITNKAFADDANLISNNGKSLEKLLERFNQFLKWVKMSVAQEKFNVFNFTRKEKRIITKDVEIRFDGSKLPNSRREHSSFKLLGKEIYITQPERGLVAIGKELNDIMKAIDNDVCPNHIKIKMYNLAIQTLRWKLQTIELTETNVKQDLQVITTRYLKKWTGLNRSSNTSILYISKKRHGLGNVDIIALWKAGVISKHHILKYSKDPWIQETYKKNEAKQVKLKSWNGYSALQKFENQQDKSKFISKFNERKKIGKEINKLESDVRVEQLLLLKKQGSMLRQMNQEGKGEIYCLNMKHQLKQSTIKFLTNGILNNLSTNQNKSIWYPNSISPICHRCNSQVQTLAHVLCSCCVVLNIPSEAQSNRVSYRHNKILETLINQLTSYGILNKYEVYADLPGERYLRLPEYLNLNDCNLRPDLVLVSRDKEFEGKQVVFIIELTSCMEENIEIWNKKKKLRYQELETRFAERFHTINWPIEVGARGFIPNRVNELLETLKLDKAKRKTTLEELSRTAVEASEIIFNHRNIRKWNPEQADEQFS